MGNARTGLILFIFLAASLVILAACGSAPPVTPDPIEGTVAVLMAENQALSTELAVMLARTPVPTGTVEVVVSTVEATQSPTITPVGVTEAVKILPQPLYFLADGAVWRLSEDGLVRQQVTDEELPVEDYDLLPDGQLAYLVGGVLKLFQPEGGEPSVVATSVPDNGTLLWQYAQQIKNPRLSPNQRYLAYGQNGLQLYDISNKTGEQIVENNLPLTDADPSARSFIPWLWSPDGLRILIASLSPEGDWQALVYETDGRTLSEFSTPRLREAAWSPDGRSVVLVSDPTGCDPDDIFPLLTRVDVLTFESVTYYPCYQDGLYLDIRAPFLTSDDALYILYARTSTSTVEEGFDLVSLPLLEAGEWGVPEREGGLPSFEDVLWSPDAGLLVGHREGTLFLVKPSLNQSVQELVVDGHRLTWGP